MTIEQIVNEWQEAREWSDKEMIEEMISALRNCSCLTEKDRKEALILLFECHACSGNNLKEQLRENLGIKAYKEDVPSPMSIFLKNFLAMADGKMPFINFHPPYDPDPDPDDIVDQWNRNRKHFGGRDLFPDDYEIDNDEDEQIDSDDEGEVK